MFDKIKFAQIIKKIKETYSSQEKFSEKSGIGRTYLSQYMNAKLDYPPKPKILEKLSNASHGITNYNELMKICGYIGKNSDNSIIDLYNELNELEEIYDKKEKKLNAEEFSIFHESFDQFLSILHDGHTTPETFDPNIILNDYDFISNKSKQKLYDAFKARFSYCYKDYEISSNSDITNQNKKQKIASRHNSAIVFVYGTIPAGIPMECIEDIIDTEEISTDMLKGGKQYFGLKIKGNSMYPEYLDGDTIILEKVEDCESGQDCVVMVNGNDGTFKRVFKNENGIILQPLNNEFQPMVYSNEQIKNLPVKVIGKVVELRRKK